MAELRIAALRRWGDDDRVEDLARRLRQPIVYIAAATSHDFDVVTHRYEKGCTAEGLAAELRLPRPFVQYCFRRINATARDRRA